MVGQQKGILEMARGAIMERADYEMNRIFENIQDANTKPTAKRKLVVTLTLIPDDKRQNVSVACSAVSTLAPTTPIITNLYVAGEDSDGIPQVIEMTPQIPGQVDVFGSVQESPAVLRVIK